VIGISDTVKGQIPCGFLVLKHNVSRETEKISSEVAEMVRSEIGPVAAFKTVMIVPKLPKTRSGKILRGTMQKIADGMPWTMPATIEDPGALDAVTAALTAKGYGGGGPAAARTGDT